MGPNLLAGMTDFLTGVAAGMAVSAVAWWGLERWDAKREAKEWWRK